MNASDLIQRIDDRLNPIVIKELRQAVNGRFVAAVFMMFLMISMIVVIVALMGLDSGGSTSAGAGVLLWLQGIIVGTCLLFLPSYAAIRLASEYNDNNVDLMFITTIRPRAIIWGKLLSTAIVATLIYATCMPFMTLTYLLRGVDLPSIFLVLGLGYGVVIAAAQLAIFTACVTTLRGFRVLLGLALLSALCATFGMTMGGSISIVEFGAASLGDPLQFWSVLGTVTAFLAAAVVLLYTWSVALISPPLSNRMLPVRVTMVAVWLPLSAILWIWAIATNEEEPIAVWAVGSSLYAGLILLIAICERTEWSDRIRRKLPSSKGARLVRMPFYSGAAGGVMLAVGMMAAVYAILLIMGTSFENLANRADWGPLLTIPVGVFLYIYCYGLTGMLLRRAGLENVVKQEHTWAMAFILGAVGCALPPLVFRLVLGTSWGGAGAREVWLLPNPYALFEDTTVRFSAFVFTAVWAVIITAIALPWFFGQLGRFKPADDDE